MAYELYGKLFKKFDIQKKTESFSVREFIVEQITSLPDGRSIPNYIRFQCTQDKTSLIDKYVEGTNVKVSFNVRGTKWMKDGREAFITNLDAWRLEEAAENPTTLSAPPPPPLVSISSPVKPVSSSSSTQQDNEDLPF